MWVVMKRLIDLFRGRSTATSVAGDDIRGTGYHIRGQPVPDGKKVVVVGHGVEVYVPMTLEEIMESQASGGSGARRSGT